MEKKSTLLNVVNLRFLILMFTTTLLSFHANAQVNLLDADTHPKFVKSLPVIQDLGLRIDLTAGTPEVIQVEMRQTWQDLGLQQPDGNPLTTKVWGYKFPGLQTTYPGATIVAMKDMRVNVRWLNKLPGHFLPVDGSLHMAHPMGQDAVSWYAAGNVATVTHLHGGHTESASDGLPEAWFSQDFNETGAFFIKKNYRYDNNQEAATLWYHDHALGITRLNVYAGLAGFYLLRDENEIDLINTGVLPGGAYEIEVVVQDRMFTDDGQLFLPSKTGDPWFGDPDEPLDLPFEPSVVAEFFGDFILVNGKAWPKLDVEQTKYRFRLLNGSDSRFYNFSILPEGSTDLNDAIPFMQIGTDNGLLPQPVVLTSLVLAPGERADLVVEFTDFTGSFTVVNTGPDEPFKGANWNYDTDRPAGQIMRFDVSTAGTPPVFSVAEGSVLRPPIVPLTQTGATRKLALFEGMDADGRLQPLLGVINGDNPKDNTVLNGSLAWFEAITENPGKNDVEVWEVYNNTEDAHPIHLHLVSFQILDRRPFTATVNSQDQIQHDSKLGVGGYVVESSIQTGTAEQPELNERGWKDTFVVPPGYMGRVIAKFDRPGRYVWHCHILSHEDHEMMRPFHVGPLPPLTKGKKKGAYVGDQDLPDWSGEFRLYPNPASDRTTVEFVLASDSDVRVSIYGMDGRLINTEELGRLNEGVQAISVPLEHLDKGMYIFELKAGDKQFRESIIISK